MVDQADLDLAFGYYFQSQNNFNTTACTGFGPTISSSKCSGGQQGISLLIDWRPWKRVDLYAGVMRNSVFGGLANGFNNTVNYGIRSGLASGSASDIQAVRARRRPALAPVPSPAGRVTELY